MHGVICSPWCTLQTFQSQVKIGLSIVDCFSTRHLHLCHRLEQQHEWDMKMRLLNASYHLPHTPLTQWPDLTKFLVAVVIWISHYSLANIIHTIYCFPCLYLQECLSAVSFLHYWWYISSLVLLWHVHISHITQHLHLDVQCYNLVHSMMLDPWASCENVFVSLIKFKFCCQQSDWLDAS